MSGTGSADDQSEDGELRQSPIDKKQSDVLDFSMSEDEGEAVDSLDIKPPQAQISMQTGRSKRREGHHKRSERYREERVHSHRQKHHRERKERDHQREKERYYREKLNYENYKETLAEYINERNYRERKEESSKSRHADFRKYQEKKDRDIHERHPDSDKHRKEKHDDDRREKMIGDKTLQDLRERLLSKRGNKTEEDYQKIETTDGYRERRVRDYENLESALQGEAGMYVKEIITISTDERRFRKEQREEEKLTEEERTEQEMRREKLLEAEREMARQKEQSRLERERRHIEKQAKRKLEEEITSNKRVRTDEINVVTVSDNTDEEMDREDGTKSERSETSAHRTSSNESPPSNKSNRSNQSNRSVSSQTRDISPISERSQSGTHSSERSHSRSKSPSLSPTQNGNEKEGESVMAEEKVTPKINEDLPPYYPAIQGCRSVEEFQCLNRIEEGTYGVVYRARDRRTEEIVALKRLKMEKEKEGFPITSLREINTLLKGQHPNIVTVREIVVGSNMDKIFIVMDYVEHDLKSLMETMRHKKQMFTPGEVKCLLKQLLAAVAHLHDNWILHRDLKTSNLLLSHKGILKVGDFGLAREYGSPLKAYTPIVVTLWYRAPELLLCTKEYSTPIDMWSVGCIFAELLLMNALFPGKSEVDQLNRVFKDLGTPSEKIWPGFKQLPAVQKIKFTEYPVSNLRNRFSMLTELGISLLGKFLTYDPQQRITAEDALKHSYFGEAPLPIDPAMFPTWPAKSELGHRRALAASPKPPSGGKEYKQLGRDGDDDGYGFRIGISAADSRRLAMGGGFSLKF